MPETRSLGNLRLDDRFLFHSIFPICSTLALYLGPSPAASLPSSKIGVSSSRPILSDPASTTLEEGIDPPAFIKVKRRCDRGGRSRRGDFKGDRQSAEKRPCKANASDGTSMSIKLFPNGVPRTCLDPVLFDLGASWRAPPNPSPSSYQTLEKRTTMATLVLRFWWGGLLKILCPTALTSSTQAA